MTGVSGRPGFPDNRVAVSRVPEYDAGLIRRTIEGHFAALGLQPDFFGGKTILLKPNLVSDRGPEKATTTHPAVVLAAVRLLREWGADVLIAESASGDYTERRLLQIYQSSQFYEEARSAGARFNFDTEEVSVPVRDAKACKRFSMIKPVADADIIVNLCKLKTHGMVKMTNAVKNFYGVIPGRQKVELHARYAEPENFCQMLIDLCLVICQSKPVITICDAIMAMEGDGPGTGDPRWLYALLTGTDPFALDLAAAELISYSDTVLTVDLAKRRGLCPQSFSELEIIGDDFAALQVDDFRLPEAQGITKYVRFIPDFMKPHPVINSAVCVGCGVCAKSCPKETIRIAGGRAHIERKNCIRCFCCQELCPHRAVNIKRNVILNAFVRHY